MLQDNRDDLLAYLVDKVEDLIRRAGVRPRAKTTLDLLAEATQELLAIHANMLRRRQLAAASPTPSSTCCSSRSRLPEDRPADRHQKTPPMAGFLLGKTPKPPASLTLIQASLNVPGESFLCLPFSRGDRHEDHRTTPARCAAAASLSGDGAESEAQDLALLYGPHLDLGTELSSAGSESAPEPSTQSLCPRYA